MMSQPAEIDELAVVQVAIDGMRLHLKGRERDEAIRMMHRRIDADIIAWRLYTTTRTVQRIAARLGLTHATAPACDLEYSGHEPPAQVSPSGAAVTTAMVA